jgi:transposase InsO family protein
MARRRRGNYGRGPLQTGPGRSYPVELRLRVIQEVMERGASRLAVSRLFGISISTINTWVDLYEAGGLDALIPRQSGPTAEKSTHAPAKRDAVVEMREANPDYGTRRIRDMLARFDGLGVSETQVRAILHEAGLIEEQAPTGPREHPPRRFERAEPNQLWQSDIFTFLLRKHERLYLVGFMDDHSRYIVSFALAHHQKSNLVMEALSRGIAEYGTPKEVLTDQGRQYTAWRGETEFEEELRKHGIRHVKSRPQHPQTLGKIERFWKTLWDEFLSRTVFADFADCHRRIVHYINAYNFQRPHQALEGLVPADRFFRAAPHVREAIEQGVADNEMRLAREQPPRKPFYLVGRLGDRDVSISAQGDALKVQLGDDQQVIALRKDQDDDHDKKATQTQRKDTKATAAADPIPPTGAVGPRRDGPQEVSDDLERALRRSLSLGRDRAGADLERLLLRSRGAGAGSDVGGSDAGRRESGVEPAGTHHAARGAVQEARAGQAPQREAPSSDEARDQTGDGEDHGGQAAQETDVCKLDAPWEQAFAELDEEPERFIERVRLGVDPDEGWRGRALRWDRKLAGASALDYERPAEVCGGQKDEDVHADAGSARGDSGEIHGGDAGAVGRDDRVGRSAQARHEPQSIPNDDAQGDGGDDRGDDAKVTGPKAAAGAAGEAAGRAREAQTRERQAQDASGLDAPDAGARGGHLQSADRPSDEREGEQAKSEEDEPR